MLSLSIVIPTYNEERFLSKLLEALSRQTIQPKEVIVSDAHSTDLTREIAGQFGTVVVNGGLPGPGRNRGAERATGDWLLFLDADIVLSDDAFLERAISEMEARKLLIACPDIMATEDWRAKLFFQIYTRFTHLLARRYPHVTGMCIFVRRTLHETIHGFDETILYAEDNEYGSRATEYGQFGYLHETLFTPPRRFQRDGYLRSGVMNVLAELHLRLFGPIRKDLFRYRFGYDMKKK